MTLRLPSRIAALLLTICAVLQYNDPDGWIWMIVYGAAAAACLIVRPPVGWTLPAVIAVVCSIWAAVLGSRVSPELRPGHLVQSMEAGTPGIEQGRELLGLLIVAAWMAILAIARRPRGKRETTTMLLVFTAFATLAPTLGPADDAPRATNVILMVADGAGFNTWQAAAMYEGRLGNEIYDGPGWTRVAASTYPLRRAPWTAVPEGLALVQLTELVYDPGRAWDTRPADGERFGYPYYFEGYRWLRSTAADSAATASALVTGHKSYNGAINVDGRGRPVLSLAEAAHDRGKRVGVLTNVPLVHATSAAMAGAHGTDRWDYCEMVIEMLGRTTLDFVAGCGHPAFDNNGEPITDDELKDFRFFGDEKLWAFLNGETKLSPGDSVCQARRDGPIVLTAEQIEALDSWVLEQTRSAIRQRRRGKTPERLLVVPQVGQVRLPGAGDDGAHFVGSTLQQQRGSRANPRYTPPGYDPPIESVPSLATLVEVGLNALDDDPDGFFFAVEGGAVDWAMHATQMGRMVEEMSDFNRAIEAAAAWIETNDAWDRTLLVVTADHDHLLWGPNSDTIAFDPLVDRGARRLPAYRWLSKSHGNALVPVVARGLGADRLATAAAGLDPLYGPYLDQTDIHAVMSSVLLGEPVTTTASRPSTASPAPAAGASPARR